MLVTVMDLYLPREHIRGNRREITLQEIQALMLHDPTLVLLNELIEINISLSCT